MVLTTHRQGYDMIALKHKSSLPSLSAMLASGISPSEYLLPLPFLESHVTLSYLQIVNVRSFDPSSFRLEIDH